VIYAPKIVHETLSDETIVIHLDTGNYYSLTGSGAEIWALLNGAGSAAAISAALARRHGRPEAEIRGVVESFICDLEGEGLVADSDTAPDSLPIVPAPAGGPWEPPKLERYDDMRDFLLVDPIHEVNETGWPSRQAS
jgi:hypothetical protein